MNPKQALFSRSLCSVGSGVQGLGRARCGVRCMLRESAQGCVPQRHNMEGRILCSTSEYALLVDLSYGFPRMRGCCFGSSCNPDTSAWGSLL